MAHFHEFALRKTTLFPFSDRVQGHDSKHGEGHVGRSASVCLWWRSGLRWWRFGIIRHYFDLSQANVIMALMQSFPDELVGKEMSIFSDFSNLHVVTVWIGGGVWCVNGALIPLCRKGSFEIARLARVLLTHLSVTPRKLFYFGRVWKCTIIWARRQRPGWSVLARAIFNSESFEPPLLVISFLEGNWLFGCFAGSQWGVQELKFWCSESTKKSVTNDYFWC